MTLNIKKGKGKLDSQRISMIKRLRAIYKEGDMYPIKILFSSDSFIDLLSPEALNCLTNEIPIPPGAKAKIALGLAALIFDNSAAQSEFPSL